MRQKTYLFFFFTFHMKILANEMLITIYQFLKQKCLPSFVGFPDRAVTILANTFQSGT